MIGLAPAWQQSLPHAIFLAPHAPQRCGAGPGYQWWQLAALTPQALAAGAASAAPSIHAFLDRKLQQYALSDTDVAIVGFSQGTMMALHIGLRRSGQVAAIVGYSGMLTATADVRDKIAKPPILLIHGSSDPIVPVAALHTAETELRHLGIEVSTHVSPGTGHTIDPVGLRLGREFVMRAWRDRQ
jgi:phospholipase/carboxylesterase